MLPDDPRHGTRAGYDAHSRADQPACADCRRAAARYEAILNLERLRGYRRTVLSVGTSRRLQALVAIGYTFGDLGTELGVCHDVPRTLATRQPGMIYTSTAVQVAKLFSRLAVTPPRPVTPLERRRVAYAKRVAERHGWVTAMAWDDIDNPESLPHTIDSVDKTLTAADEHQDIDHVAVDRVLEGEKVPGLSRAERTEVVRRTLAAGGSLNSLRRLTGWKVERYLDEARNGPTDAIEGALLSVDVRTLSATPHGTATDDFEEAS